MMYNMGHCVLDLSDIPLLTELLHAVRRYKYAQTNLPFAQRLTAHDAMIDAMNKLAHVPERAS